MNVLVTGATGYIGSHAVLELLQTGHHVVGVDNLSNSSSQSLERVAELTNGSVALEIADIRDGAAMAAVLQKGLTKKADKNEPFDAVMHFAGLKAVGESVEQPLTYYENNVGGTLALLKAMDGVGLRRVIFSSSATVYGDPAQVPISETAPTTQPSSPYGMTKLMIEQILHDLSNSDPRWAVARLRYFNPVGAHPSGKIGEDPQGIPNNLVPFISQVAVGRRDSLSIFGNDWPTPDGTGVRDYIHVVDLVRGHLAALEYLANTQGCHTWNLGTGRGYSVREVIGAFERACDQEIPVKIAPRRAGDVAECYADPSRANTALNWRAEYDLGAMMRDAWHWQQQNPHGYGDAKATSTSVTAPRKAPR